ncbi:MAG: histidine phosphatase family protein [Candidatus Micrarchaeia archaeon]
MSSYVIRHCKTTKSWDTLSYGSLVRLLRQESNPSIDFAYITANLDREKIRSMRISNVYSSPIKRAMQTAKYIAKIARAHVIPAEQLGEIVFDSLPRSTYYMGSGAIRSYLVEKSYATKIEFDPGTFEDNSIIVTHGFIMRRIYSSAFGVEMDSLKNNSMFKEYLSGFDLKTGKKFSLLKSQKAKRC